MLFTGTRKNPQVLQLLRNAVWHYRGLDSRANEEPVKDISAKQEDCGVNDDARIRIRLECVQIMSGQIQTQVTHNFTVLTTLF